MNTPTVMSTQLSKIHSLFGLTSALKLIHINTVSLGYALFLAINATAVWGGVFPFLPYQIQSFDTMFWFFFNMALVFAIAYGASVIGSYFLPREAKHFLVFLAGLPYVLAWVCLIASSYLKAYTFGLVAVSGIFLGIGSAGFYMLWQRLFAAMDPRTGNENLISGTLLASVIYALLHTIPQAVTVFLIPLVFLPLFGLAIVLTSRRIDVNQPMFEDVPRAHAHVYKRVISDTWRSALCLGGLGFCTGVMRAVAITDPHIGYNVNLISMGASFIAAFLLMVFWARANVTINVLNTYRTIFPVILLSFVLLALTPAEVSIWLAGVLYAFHSVGILFTMIMCAQLSRDRGINPVFIYGFFGGIMYALHDLGFLLGSFARSPYISAEASMTMIALIAVSVLSLLFALGQKQDKMWRAEFSHGSSIELTQDEHDTGVSREHRVPDEPDSGDVRISPEVYRLKDHYGLTMREAEVTELLAGGETVARIADVLFISENTVRMHSKHIYTKLDIHKKQEIKDRIRELTS